MGAPVTYALESEGKRIYIYQHSDGYEYEAIFQGAINYSRPNWGDEPYMNRMIIDHIVFDHEGEIGFGISPHIQDTMFPILVVNHDDRVVYIDGKRNVCASYDDFVTFGLQE